MKITIFRPESAVVLCKSDGVFVMTLFIYHNGAARLPRLHRLQLQAFVHRRRDEDAAVLRNHQACQVGL